MLRALGLELPEPATDGSKLAALSASSRLSGLGLLTRDLCGLVQNAKFSMPTSFMMHQLRHARGAGSNRTRRTNTRCTPSRWRPVARQNVHPLPGAMYSPTGGSAARDTAGADTMSQRTSTNAVPMVGATACISTTGADAA